MMEKNSSTLHHYTVVGAIVVRGVAFEDIGDVSRGTKRAGVVLPCKQATLGSVDEAWGGTEVALCP